MIERTKQNGADPVGSLYWRDEILQVMYWMTGEGFGQEFAISELQKFLSAEPEILKEHLEGMVDGGLVESSHGSKYSLTDLGHKEGGRRFADEFESMLKPGHFECDEPDCDCHNADSIGECKHLSAHTERVHS